jgi:hypothetical protein
MTLAIDLEAEQDRSKPWWFTVYPPIEAEKEEDCRPAVRVLFAPIGRIALRAARRAAGEVYLGADLPEDENAPVPAELIEMAGDALSDSLLMAGIIEWEGVGIADTPVAVTPERLAQFLADPIRFERLDQAYVQPFVTRELEKNGLSLSLNGSSAGATATAGTSAAPTKRAGASRTKKKA